MKLIEEEPEALEAIRAAGVSIANRLRPIAGNRFTSLVKEQIEKPLVDNGIGCATRGKIKKELAKLIEESNKKVNLSQGVDESLGGYKPDIDIVCYDIETNKAFLIISCKTSLAERIMQTVVGGLILLK